MAKVAINQIVQGISGSIGGLVFRQMPNGSTYVSAKHDFSKRKFSQGQKTHQSRFREAVAYARAASKTQPIYAKLAKGTIQSAYNWALSDWFNPPVIHRIERKGGHIRVEATDNVMVTRVLITIQDEKGRGVAKGTGIKGEGNWWEVTLAEEGKVLAEAWDLAGNMARMEAG